SSYSPGCFPKVNFPARPGPDGPKWIHAICSSSREIKQGLVQSKKVNSLKLRDLGLSRVLITVAIFILHDKPPLATDDEKG
ncbi:hypothetical protein PFISCL1PPCAC_4145, partial [Pristionchus fissidentatus]